MAFQSPHATPYCCCCGSLLSWGADEPGTPGHEGSTRAQTTGVFSTPLMIGTDQTADEPTIAEPDGGTQLPPPVPNPVCRDCARTAKTTDGASIDPPPVDFTLDLPAATPATGPNPVVVDGITCWRIGTDEDWQLARDALGCGSAAEFLRRHTDSDGRPVRWFGIDRRGSPQQLRIEPDAVIDVTRFCDSFADGTAIQIETTPAVRAIETPVVDVRRESTSTRFSQDTPRLSGLTVESSPRRVVVPIDAIASVAVTAQTTVGPPNADATVPQLKRYGQLATVAPGVIDIAGLTAVTEAADPHQQTIALRIAASVLASTATPGLTAIPSLVACLDNGRLSRLYALRSLGHIAELYPDSVADVIDAVIDTIPADNRLVETAATQVIARVADHEPGAVIDAIPAIGSILAPTPTQARRQALATAGCVAKSHPDAVRPLVPQLCSLLETDDTAYRISATAALGRVTAAYPAAATPAVPTLLAQLPTDNPELRANTVGVLGDIATEYPTDIAPYTDELAALLDDDDPTVRSNTAGAFARVASVKPRHVRPFVDALIDLLEDSWTRSRVHACWALGRCGTAAAVDSLAECRQSDPKESVRERAAWALAQIR